MIKIIESGFSEPLSFLLMVAANLQGRTAGRPKTWHKNAGG